MANNKLSRLLVSISLIIVFLVISNYDSEKPVINNNSLFILSSIENQALENEITKYARKKNINLQFSYAGDIEIVDKLNSQNNIYDAVWISNSMWLYMLDNQYLTSNSKSISTSPIVFGIKISKAKELNLINKDVSNMDILKLIKDKKIKYIMPSVTKTNSGATAYLGFVSALAGNSKMLTEESLDNEELLKNIRDIFTGVERVSGDEKYLEEMFVNSSSYEAVIASESSLIEINKKLKSKKREELYFIYPTDGVAVNDSAFAFLGTNKEKEESFLEIQKYLLSSEGQKMLEEKGYRTWYGGTTEKSDKNVFNPAWGIDTTKYLSITRFPSKNVITKALNIYIEELRKPTHVVFCLDYSDSMYPNGFNELTNALDYILDYDRAKKDNLQFSKYDKITVITFGSKIGNIWTIDNGRETKDLINKIKNEQFRGMTALYDAVNKGINILSKETDDYTKTIIAMTDGYVNIGSFYDVKKYYNQLNSKIPIYSITFGNAKESELQQLATLSNAKVFDGKNNLLNAFKEVRGYN